MLELPHLRGIEDKRRAQGRRYDLEHVLLCCVLAVAAGADSYRAMARFIKAKFQWLREHSALRWRKAPSHTGLRAVLLSVDQPAVEQALRSYAAGVLEAGREGGAASCTIAIDGKTLRGSVDRFADVPALQWVSAFAAQQRLVVGQIALSGEDKGSEIAAARKLIEELGLSGKLFTLDALHCQKQTLQAAVQSGNDVLVQVKGNQPTLLQGITALAEAVPASQSWHHDEIGKRNRIESRQTQVWPIAAGQAGADWQLVRSVIRVRRHTEVFDTRDGAWRPRSEIAWYVCTRDLTARAAHDAVRGHWMIENALHHVRDVAFAEDASRIRREPGVFAQLRTWALNLMRCAGFDNIKAARQLLAWSDDALLNLVSADQH